MVVLNHLVTLLFILVMYMKKGVNSIHIHVVSVVHTCKSINSHVISNFIINTLITYSMAIHIIFYTGSSFTCQ